MAVKTRSAHPSYGLDPASRGFKVHEFKHSASHPSSLNRRDFYKIVLVTGDMTINYGDQLFRIKDTFLFLANPTVSYSVVDHSPGRRGYVCLFTKTFMAARDRAGILQQSPLFRAGEIPIFRLNTEQVTFLTGIFQKMMDVNNGDYQHKDDLLGSCITLILHEVLRIKPANNNLEPKDGATRITRLFMELLERQFPVDSTGEPLRLRTAHDFAGALAVHVNYLTRSLKEVTGKPASAHIAERVVAEAKALLIHTNWSIADIAYSLGFEYPTYFNTYFKRIAAVTPNPSERKRFEN
ncbi:helix-turn-helix transcriptional regulator [Paraflavitalea speifideaquila]|uniref:helix-turn-helix domain-containing protein n=1 Tax=Paraflavitalea speifideaquila TaxID=3076558 RepID=UPI0028EF7380|nr:helix-turn-helix transcriptional regulator [Paraflavitalea speifideiaquila]